MEPEHGQNVGRLRDRGAADRGPEILEHGSDRRETLPPRVSDDSVHLNDLVLRFSLIWHGFGAATAERTSKSASSSNFALERLIHRSTRPQHLRFGLSATQVNATPLP